MIPMAKKTEKKKEKVFVPEFIEELRSFASGITSDSTRAQGLALVAVIAASGGYERKADEIFNQALLLSMNIEDHYFMTMAKREVLRLRSRTIGLNKKLKQDFQEVIEDLRNQGFRKDADELARKSGKGFGKIKKIPISPAFIEKARNEMDKANEEASSSKLETLGDNARIGRLLFEIAGEHMKGDKMLGYYSYLNPSKVRKSMEAEKKAKPIVSLFGILSLLSLLILNLAIYQNFESIQALLSIEIAAITLLLFPFVSFVAALLFLILVGYIVEQGLHLLFRIPRKYAKENGGEDTLFSLSSGAAVSISLPIMAYFYSHVADSLIAGISSQGLIFLIPLAYLLIPAFFILIYVFEKVRLEKMLAGTPFFIILALPPLILCLLVGFNSPDLMSAALGTALLYMVFPKALILYFFSLSILTVLKGEAKHTGNFPIMAFFLPFLYPAFAIAGAILGAVAFFIASLF